MRRACAIAVSLTLASGVSACGKSNPTAAGGSTTAGATTTTPAPVPGAKGSSPRTTAQARRYVAVVNLRASDLPGFHRTSERGGSSSGGPHEEASLLRCIGLHGGQGQAESSLADGGSGTFSGRGGGLAASVSSHVSVSSTAALAGPELKLLRSARVRGCLARYFERLLGGQRLGGARVTSVTVAQGSPPAKGTDGGYGWRVTATLRAGGVQLRIYLDILGFIDGPADVTLLTTASPVPLPASVEERLFALLLERAVTFSR